MAVLAPPAHAAPVDITIVGTNDFHGRLLPDRDIPGAAKYAGALNSIRDTNPNTIFAAAGDLIGATTFESFINQDKPTIDVLNEMGLDVSAVGNHELDKGWDDLTQRVMQPAGPGNEHGGAAWQYIVANLDGPPGEEELIPDSWTTEIGGATVGFVGAVTEDLASLVSPDGIAGVEVLEIVESVNAEADRLVTEENADLVVMLVHEGSPSTDCATMSDPATTWGSIVTGVNDNVDAIISGHTHLAYNCTIGDRPVVSAGQYGAFLNRLDFTVDPETDEVSVTQELVNINTGTFEPDPDVQGIVDQAIADAEGPGSVRLGDIAGPFNRAQRPTEADPTLREENRGAESTLGNQVAEVQRWATETDIAFMNPGGLRADMIGEQDDDDNTPLVFPTTLTYKQAAVVQPFANTLVTMDMTGAQIKSVLEQQWQRDDMGSVPSRPFLRLGTSAGFRQVYDPMRPEGDRITGMWLHGDRVRMDQTYRVTVNSFLASGGDNFHAFEDATDKRDSGKVDLEAMVDYMEEFASDTPLAPDFGQRAIGVIWPDDTPASYGTGDRVTFDLTSLAMTGPGDVQDQQLVIRFNGKKIGTASVDNAVEPGTPFDESGKATVDVTLPRYAGTPGAITMVGRQTGTRLTLPLETRTQAKSRATMTLKRKPARVVRDKTRVRIIVRVMAAGDPASGRVLLRGAGQTHVSKLNDKGRAVVRLKPIGGVGKKTVRVLYLGDDATRQVSKKISFRVFRR